MPIAGAYEVITRPCPGTITYREDILIIKCNFLIGRIMSPVIFLTVFVVCCPYIYIYIYVQMSF